MAHAYDLREEIAKENRDWSEDQVWKYVAAVVRNPSSELIDEPTKVLLQFAIHLTRLDPRPAPNHLDVLRAHGFSDVDIHDSAQVIGYFNYITRIVDALGVPLDSWLIDFKQRLDKIDQ